MENVGKLKLAWISLKYEVKPIKLKFYFVVFLFFNVSEIKKALFSVFLL